MNFRDFLEYASHKFWKAVMELYSELDRSDYAVLLIFLAVIVFLLMLYYTVRIRKINRKYEKTLRIYKQNIVNIEQLYVARSLIKANGLEGIYSELLVSSQAIDFSRISSQEEANRLLDPMAERVVRDKGNALNKNKNKTD